MNDQIHFLDHSDFSCADMETLVNHFIDGELLASLSDRFSRHLARCESCREMLDDYKRIVELARTLEDKPIPRDVSGRLRQAIRQRTGTDAASQKPHLMLVKR